MKKFKFLAVFAALVFAMSLGLQAQPVDCWDNGYDCGPELSGQYTFTYPDTDCDITVYYKYQICKVNDVVVGYNFRLIGISFLDDEDCNYIKARLEINLEGLIGNQVVLFEIWNTAFQILSNQWFTLLGATNYPCGTSNVTFRTVVPGGCASFAWAWRPSGPQGQGPREYRFIPVPCTTDGCCIIDKIMCWNTQTLQVDYSLNITILGGDNCEETSPLYDPFEVFGPEWYVETPTPCQQMCYIWSIN
jgi:hypothetical protein